MKRAREMRGEEARIDASPARDGSGPGPDPTPR